MRILRPKTGCWVEFGERISWSRRSTRGTRIHCYFARWPVSRIIFTIPPSSHQSMKKRFNDYNTTIHTHFIYLLFEQLPHEQVACKAAQHGRYVSPINQRNHQITSSWSYPNSFASSYSFPFFFLISSIFLILYFWLMMIFGITNHTKPQNFPSLYQLIPLNSCRILSLKGLKCYSFKKSSSS